MYTPPNDNESQATGLPGPTELDTAVSDFISTAQAEFGEPEAPADAGVAADVPTPEAPVVPAPAPTAGETSPQAAGDPTDRGLERLVAREVELRERESKVSGAEKEIQALRARLQEIEPRALNEDLLNRIKLSPAEGLRAIGLDPEEVIRTALMEKLGDKADPALRETLERTRLQREMMALKAQVQEAERRQAAQAYFTQVANGAQAYLSKVEELSKNAPTVAHVAKTAPDRAYSEIMDEITRDAASRAAREPNGDVISYEEAAKRVEARWSGLKKMLGVTDSGPSAPQAPASTTGTTAVPPTTKQNVGKPAPATIKPADKPLAPWLKRSSDEEDAIRAAIDEWKRTESR